jgi:hypothetical protein
LVGAEGTPASEVRDTWQQFCEDQIESLRSQPDDELVRPDRKQPIRIAEPFARRRHAGTKSGGGVMSHRLLLGFVAIGINMAALVSASAQPINRTQAATAVHDANALSGRIRAYHRGPGSWRGSGPPPPGYCGTMSAGEMVLKELVRLTNAAVSNRQTGLVLSLERVANRLSDELDEEEAINLVAGFSYAEYPCLAATPAPVARALVLRAIEQRAPACRRQADVRLLSFNARRTFMWDCLRLGIY